MKMCAALRNWNTSAYTSMEWSGYSVSEKSQVEKNVHSRLPFF